MSLLWALFLIFRDFFQRRAALAAENLALRPPALRGTAKRPRLAGRPRVGRRGAAKPDHRTPPESPATRGNSKLAGVCCQWPAGPHIGEGESGGEEERWTRRPR